MFARDEGPCLSIAVRHRSSWRPCATDHVREEFTDVDRPCTRIMHGDDHPRGSYVLGTYECLCTSYAPKKNPIRSVVQTSYTVVVFTDGRAKNRERTQQAHCVAFYFRRSRQTFSKNHKSHLYSTFPQCSPPDPMHVSPDVDKTLP